MEHPLHSPHPATAAARQRLNWPVVLTTALLSGVALLLFFASQRRMAAPPIVAAADTIAATDGDDYSELDYYNQLADDYLAMLPADREVVARLIDDNNHYIYYYEHSSNPSCYCYDLETLTTSVLFGGEEGFYCDTKLLIIGTIKEWRRCGDRLCFIAVNHAPEAGYADAVLVFALHIDTRRLDFIASAAGATFASDTQLTLQRARLLYVSLFTDEPVYTTETVNVLL